MKTTVENSERLDRQGTLGKFLMSTPERNARICVDYLLKGKSLIILNKLSWLVMNYAPDWLKTRLISEASKKRYWNNILNIKSNAKNCFIKRMKNIFISGISGLLGTNLVNILLEQGYKVTGVIRNPDNFTGTRNENLTLLKGGLFDDYSAIFSVTDIVIHIAAETKQNILRYEEYYKTNFEATRHLYETAVKSDVKKFIFVSTANTSGFADSEGLGNEDKPMKFPFTKSFYALSKKLRKTIFCNKAMLQKQLLSVLPLC